MNYLRTCACTLAALLLAGCATASAQPTAAKGHAATGHVTGRFFMEGGAISLNGQQPGDRPIPGTVTFTAAGHRTGRGPGRILGKDLGVAVGRHVPGLRPLAVHRDRQRVRPGAGAAVRAAHIRDRHRQAHDHSDAHLYRSLGR